MGAWRKNKVESSMLNGGQEYTKDSSVSLEQLNAITNNSFYAVDKADEALTKANSAFENNGTVVKVANSAVTGLDFDSDPQTQINEKANQSDLDSTNGDISIINNMVTALTNSKANNDLANVTYPSITAGSTTSGSGDRVVEQYLSSDGQTWYRKWASGWKECGFFISGKKNTDIPVTTPSTFSNTGSVSQMTKVWTSSGGHRGAWDPGGFIHKTTNSFIAVFTTWNSNAPTNVQCQVYCCGY